MKKKIIDKKWTNWVKTLPLPELQKIQRALNTVMHEDYPDEYDKERDERAPEFQEMLAKDAYLDKLIFLKRKEAIETPSAADTYKETWDEVRKCWNDFSEDMMYREDAKDTLNAGRALRNALDKLLYKMGGE
jgi:hypothetical protein